VSASINKSAAAAVAIASLFLLLLVSTIVIALLRYGNLHKLPIEEKAQRLSEYHHANCQVKTVQASEGMLSVECLDKRRVEFYMPLQCEEDSLLCAMGVDAACWELTPQD